MPSDGDCLFASIAHQLSVLGLLPQLSDTCAKFGVSPPIQDDVKSNIRCLRLLASAVIRKNGEDFLPFICSDLDPSSDSPVGKSVGIAIVASSVVVICFDFTTVEV